MTLAIVPEGLTIQVPLNLSIKWSVLQSNPAAMATVLMHSTINLKHNLQQFICNQYSQISMP